MNSLQERWTIQFISLLLIELMARDLRIGQLEKQNADLSKAWDRLLAENTALEARLQNEREETVTT
jgi:molecular chaperone GrpE (heat shock protein)